MPLRVLPGGISYPNAVAFKRGPQVLAIDQSLNVGISSLNEINATKNGTLIDSNASLPADWGWKEAYGMEMKVNDRSRKIVMVPFSEAGQKSANIAVWINQ